MRTTSILAAALVAATAVAGHEEPKPRIYFPRHVKRFFSNVTITSASSLESQSSSSSADLTASKTLPRADDPISEAQSSPRVTTVVIQSTIFVPRPTGAANSTTSTSSTGSDSDTTTSKDSTTEEETTSNALEDEDPTSLPNAPSSDAPTSSSDASTGGIPSSVVQPTTRATTTKEEETSTASESEPAETPSSSEPPLAANTTSPTSTSSDAPVSVAPTTTSTTSGILLGPSSIVTTTTSVKDDPLEPIESIISSIFNPPKPGNTTDTPTSEPAPATTTTTEREPEPTPEPTPDISLPISLPISDPTSTTKPVDPPPESTPPPISTPPPVVNTTSSLPGIPDPSSVISPPPVISKDPINTTSVVPPPPVSNSTISPTPSVPNTITSGPTSEPTTLPPPVPVTNSTTNSTLPTSPTTIAPAPITTTSSTTGGEVTSVPILGTTSNSEGAFPTTIIVDSGSTTVSGIIAPTSTTGIPSALPKAINPETWEQPQPDDTELIQIGFFNSLNYPFIVEEPVAAAQIFRLLPDALVYNGDVDKGKVKVMRLVPLDTRASMGYLTTLAIVSYPNNLVDTLQMDIRLANSNLYLNPEQIVYNLTQQINSAIDIKFGSTYGGAPGEGGWGEPNDPSQAPADPFGGDSTPDNQTSAQKGATAGIVAGSVGIAAAYGAAMFIIARRYKRKKQAHRRASSISNPSEMQYTSRGSPALMGGALLSRDFSTYGATSGGVAGGRDSHGSGRSGMGNSGRTAYISAPVAAENSLGWN